MHRIPTVADPPKCLTDHVLPQEEVQRAVAEVKSTPAINVRSAALVAETRGQESSGNHAETLLAWGKQASERKERKRQELEAKLQPPPSPAINA
jgi:hypothetical protein